jgi:membrane protease subunit HflC
LAFTQAVGAEGGAEGKLDGLLTNAAIGTLGGHDLSALVSTNPADLQTDQIEAELLASTAQVALRNYGVAIEQIRLERIALPEENVAAVFDQMRAERRQFAAKFEAEGELEASRIRSEAELEAARIRAKGAEEQARIRGESAAQIAKTYADAHKVNPELYRFTRSLDSLEKLVRSNTTLILRTDSEPFSLLQNKDGK